MSSLLNYNLCVLASDSKEVKDIAVRLNEPSKDLGDWLCERLQLPRIDGLGDVLDFEIVGNLTNIEAAVRTFRLTIQDRFCGMVAFHLSEISAAFPSAIFLLETEGLTFLRKEVLRKGCRVQEIHRDNRANQVAGGCILDIFVPFRAEHSAHLAFGSLWKSWLDDTAAALQELKSNSNSASESPKLAEQRCHTDTKLRVSVPIKASGGIARRKLSKRSSTNEGG